MTSNESSNLQTDIVVIGGGPAGLTCAIEARRELNAKTLLAERASYFGGTPQSTYHLGFGVRDLHRIMTGPNYASELERRANNAGVILRSETTVNSWTTGFVVDLAGGDTRYQTQTRAIVLATGVRERTRHARLVAGDRGSGVYTTGALQRLVYQLGAKVGKRALIVGAEHVSFTAISTLRHGGCKTIAMLTPEPHDQTYLPLRWLYAKRNRVPLIINDNIATIHGDKRITGVTLNSGRQIECDTIVFTGNWIPESDLARLGGLDINSGSKSPAVDSFGRTKKPGVFAIGNAVHPAEASDVCALHARRTTAGLRHWLHNDEWIKGESSIRAGAGVLWTWPSLATSDDADSKMLLRVEKSSQGPTQISIRQGSDILWSKSRRSTIISNRSISLPMSWVSELNPAAGDIEVVLEQ